VDTIGLYDGAANRFRLRNENAVGAADLEFVYGIGKVRPLAGDWNGDGVDTVGVLDPSTGTAYLRNTNDAGAEDIVFATGRAGMVPVVGDFDGDGVDSIGMYGGDGLRFFLRDSLDAAEEERVVALGSRASIWAPLAGRWDVSGDTGEHTGFDWVTDDPESAGFDAELLSAAYGRAAEIRNLHSLLVVRHGSLVGEAYYGGYDASMANCLKSVSKSFLSALYGLALEDGHLRGLEQPVSAFLPEYYQDDAEPRLGRTTINHLLTMRSGQAWTDSTHLGPMVASEDWVGHVAGLPFARDPGTRMTYNTGITHVASTLLTRATGMATHEYAEQRLFEPLGISATRWDYDPAGIDFGGAEVWMRPRDMARFGELYLRGGTIDERRIVGADWVSRSTRGIVSSSGEQTYGAWWWQRTFAEREVYFAWGAGGQFIFIVPELDMVVVTTSSWFRGRSTTKGPVFALLEEHILPAVVGD
jgi:CubicO group peptidase (beta-lactamase class C family)